MTDKEVLDILHNELKCVQTNCNRDCSKCNIALPSPKPIEESLKVAIKTMNNIKSLGNELRTFRGGIKNKKVLVGFNLAVAICNKYLSEESRNENDS